MIRLIVFTGALLCGWLDASAQYADADPQSAVISMTRENSCGFVQSDPTDIRQCPDYSITLSGDGTVTYEGRSGVRTIGARTHTIAPDEFRQLLTAFLQADFFSLRDRYDSITHADGTVTIMGDVATTTIEVSIGDETKRVRYFYGAPT